MLEEAVVVVPLMTPILVVVMVETVAVVLVDMLT